MNCHTPHISGYTARTAHQSRHLLDPLNRKRRGRKRFHRNGHQFHGIVVRRDAVGTHLPALAAAVYDRPLAVFSNPYCHRLHIAAAVRSAVSRLDIHMQACQTVRAVVSVLTARAVRDYLPPANLTYKAFIAGMIFVISFFKCFSLIFPIQFCSLLIRSTLLHRRFGSHFPENPLYAFFRQIILQR